MGKYIDETTMAFDELIGGTSVTPLVFNATVTAAAAGTIKKGTLLTEASGKFAPTVAEGVAAAVLAEDIVAAEAGDVTGTIYVRGIFNREKLIAATGDTVVAHEPELRKIGIYMTGLK